MIPWGTSVGLDPTFRSLAQEIFRNNPAPARRSPLLRNVAVNRERQVPKEQNGQVFREFAELLRHETSVAVIKYAVSTVRRCYDSTHALRHCDEDPGTVTYFPTTS